MPQAAWARDVTLARDLRVAAEQLDRSAIRRRCSKPTGEGERKCTMDVGHDGPCECNVERDIEGE